MVNIIEKQLKLFQLWYVNDAFYDDFAYWPAVIPGEDVFNENIDVTSNLYDTIGKISRINVV